MVDRTLKSNYYFSRQLDKSFHRLGQTLMRIEEDVIRLKHETKEGRWDINELLEYYE